MKRQMRRIIASMLAVTTVLSNSNLAVFAEEAGSKNQSVMEEEQQEEQQENESDTQPEEQQEEQQEETEVSGEELSENQTEVSDNDSEEVNLTLELLPAEESANANKTIRTVEQFVALSKEEAQTYQDETIILAPHDKEEWDLSGTEFAGLGSDAYPFKGSISFSGEYTGYITLGQSLFNALSGDAKINSTLNLRAADNMTAPILAENYVTGENSETSVQPIHLNIDAESKAATEEKNKYSSFGGIIGTLGTHNEKN